MINEILDLYTDEEFIILTGYDDAVIGFDEKEFRLIYSVSKIIDILSKNMTIYDALEYYYFNIESAYLGEKTPIFCQDFIF